MSGDSLAKFLREQDHGTFLRNAARHTVFSLGRSPHGADAFPGDPWPRRIAGPISVSPEVPLEQRVRLQAKVVFEIILLNEVARRQGGLTSSLSQLHAEAGDLPQQARAYLGRRLLGVYRAPQDASDRIMRAVADVRSAADLSDLVDRLTRTPSDFGSLVGRSFFGIPSRARGYARLTLRETAEMVLGSARTLLDTQAEYEERGDLLVKDLGILRQISETWRKHLSLHLAREMSPQAQYRRTPESTMDALQVVCDMAEQEVTNARWRAEKGLASAASLLESSLLPMELRRTGEELVDHLGPRHDAVRSRAAAEAVALSEMVGDADRIAEARRFQSEVESFDLGDLSRLYPREATAVQARRRALSAWEDAQAGAPGDSPQELPFSPDDVFQALAMAGRQAEFEDTAEMSPS